MKKMRNLGMMDWLNYLFLSREVRWKWYGGLELELEEGGREGGSRREGRKGKAEGLIMS